MNRLFKTYHDNEKKPRIRGFFHVPYVVWKNVCVLSVHSLHYEPAFLDISCMILPVGSNDTRMIGVAGN
ncbi:hypothetical protein ACFL6I_06180 [candidate division KSB1 bacterium]